MTIQYTVPGFEPTTFGTQVSSITTRPGRLPPYSMFTLQPCKHVLVFTVHLKLCAKGL